MFDLPGHPILDKHALVGGCIRLPLKIDAHRLLDEVARMSAAVWETTEGRGSVHSATGALFLRGYAPAEGDKPIENRPALDLLPAARSVIELIPAPPMRCLLARLPAGASIAPHVDHAPYFWKTLRIHVPVETHDRVWMLCAGKSYLMKPGEVWALNNTALHGVWNADPGLARTHLICDFLSTPALLELLARGDRDLGRTVPEVEEHFAALRQTRAAAGG